METERLIIDHFKESDKQDYFNNISHDKKVLETFMCNYVEDINDFDFTRYIGNNNFFGIRLKSTNEVIGIILICIDNGDECEIGYAIGSKHWGNGYVTEATKEFVKYCFNERNFKKIVASYFIGNDASKRVMEKCGFKYSHFVKDEFVYLDKSRDLVYYSIEK